MIVARTLLLRCIVAVILVCSAAAGAAPQTGWWWNPAESGRGFFVESDNGITFIGAYLYDADGHATWLVSGSANADPYNYTGQLYSMSSGQTLFGPYAAPVGPNVAGTITAHFTDDTHGTVTWPGGAVAIERQIFGIGEQSFKPAPGWWWNPKESGSGYSIEVQGDKLFFVGFMYDATGRPVWYFSAGPMSTLSSYSGSLLQFANGQTLGGPYKPPAVPVAIGTVDIGFASTGIGVLRLSPPPSSANASGAQPRAAVPLRVTYIQSQFPKIPETGSRYLGTFRIHETKRLTSPGVNVVVDYLWVGQIHYVEYEDADCGSGMPNRCYRAEKGGGVLTVSVKTEITGGKCTGQGVTAFDMSKSDARLAVQRPGPPLRPWSHLTALDAGTVDVTQTCTVFGQTATQTSPERASFAVAQSGVDVQNQLVNFSAYDADFEPELQDAEGSFYAESGDSENSTVFNFSPY